MTSHDSNEGVWRQKDERQPIVSSRGRATRSFDPPLALFRINQPPFLAGMLKGNRFPGSNFLKSTRHSYFENEIAQPIEKRGKLIAGGRLGMLSYPPILDSSICDLSTSLLLYDFSLWSMGKRSNLQERGQNMRFEERRWRKSVGISAMWSKHSVNTGNPQFEGQDSR